MQLYFKNSISDNEVLKMALTKNLFMVFFSLVLFFSIGNSLAQAQDPYLPFAEVMPAPVGGMEAIYKHIQYPDIAKNAGLEGKVYLLVYIDETGKVEDVKVLKGLGGGCDEAAIQGVKETKFTPGKDKGAPVKVKLSLPITFKLK